MADGFIVFGKTSKNYLLDLGATESQFIEEKGAVVDDKRIRNIYDAALNHRFLADKVKTTHNFIFVGRIIGVKNIPILIRAFQIMKASLTEAEDWGLIILGNGILDEEINREIANGDKDICKFDAVDWQTVPKYFCKSDCLVLPSKSEPWGLVVNEAMICGLGVIVSDACGCRDDLVESNGFVFESGNQNQLQEYMESFVKNVDRQESMNHKSLQIIEQFKVDSVAKRIVKGFQKIYQQA
jgi:glycosyltransferase involved in cell wall biosynthesis